MFNLVPHGFFNMKNKNKIIRFFFGKKHECNGLVMSEEFYFFFKRDGRKEKKSSFIFTQHVRMFVFFSEPKAKQKIQNSIKGRVHLINPLNKNTSPYPP
jgi:hypothetical protein